MAERDAEIVRRCRAVLNLTHKLKAGEHPRADLELLLVDINKHMRMLANLDARAELVDVDVAGELELLLKKREEGAPHAGKHLKIARMGGRWRLSVLSVGSSIIFTDSLDIQEIDTPIAGLAELLMEKNSPRTRSIRERIFSPAPGGTKSLEEVVRYMGLFKSLEIRCQKCMCIPCPVDYVVPLVRFSRGGFIVAYHIPCFLS